MDQELGIMSSSRTGNGSNVLANIWSANYETKQSKHQRYGHQSYNIISV